MLLSTVTRSSILLRTACGLFIVGSALSAGFMQRSPWIILPMGLAFSVLFIIGKWSQWQLAIETDGWKTVPLGLLSIIPTQCAIVGLFYGVALGFSKLTRDGHVIAQFGDFDTRYAAITLAVGGAMGIAAEVLEARATPEEDVFRQLMEQGQSDTHLEEELPPTQH